MEKKIEYYATLVNPFKDKYGAIIPTTKKIKVKSENDIHLKNLYASYGKEARYESYDTYFYIFGSKIIKADYPDSFTELDYVLRHKEILIKYGHSNAEYESVPCKIFKKITRIEEEIIEL